MADGLNAIRHFFIYWTYTNHNTTEKMKRKTYGVSGLMDWTTNIKAGKATINVHFSGGALTAYGVTPATYSTTNPLFQLVIENCEFFKSGRITLLSEMEVAGSTPVKTSKASTAAAVATATEEAEPQTEEGTDNADGMREVEVTDKSDAIEYLKEHYPEKGYGAVKLRTHAAFDAACSEHGIKFIYTT